MKITHLITLTSLLVLSCKNQSTDASSELRKIEIEEKVRERVDSMVKKATRDVMFDTIGLNNSPIKILSSRLVQDEYTNYKNIQLTYKNISQNKIEAIRFKWYGENAFGEPADMGGISIMEGSEGFGGGFTDQAIGAGKTRTSEWSIYSKDAKKVILAWPYEIAFSDGTIWKSKNK